MENQKKPKIALCGLAFKADIDDLRESPAIYIAEKIKQAYPKDHLFFIEPNIESHPLFEISEISRIIKEIDIAFILVGHKEFIGLNWRKQISFVQI